MRRIALACLASLLVYGAAFALVLDRPFEYGQLQARIEGKLRAGAALPSPKLVILAGSNGPYSHRCTVIGPALGMPCVNAGVAVGIGLDYLFARWAPLIHAGDIVYMPMEMQQYARGRLSGALGPDASIMWRHDRAGLSGLPPDRWIAAMFSFDARAAVMSGIEMALAAMRVREPRGADSGETNAWGDRVGHTAALASANAAFLALLPTLDERPDAVAEGYGAALIGRFVRASSERGARVVGGLPTTFDDAAPDMATIAAVRAVFERNGGTFVMLANLSRYPRSAFFDSASHLNEEAQIRHSSEIASALAAALLPRADSGTMAASVRLGP